MKISYNWLQSHIVEPLPKPEELAQKIIFGAFEVEETQQVGDDTMFDIKVLPDRAHDCLSHYGIAREVSGLLGLTLKPLEFKTHESIASEVSVSIETSMCRRYIARKVFGVSIKESPQWLKDRLETIGQRSINNVVDATNYVMFTLGQPIHAFDGDKMTSGHIIVRPGRDGESITTLDGKIVALDESIAVISDERHPLAIAGVKGGTIAEVDANTKNILIEVANFDPIAVRKTARKLGLLTDSAKRFENELTPHMAGIAIHMVTDLILELAGGQPFDPVDTYPNPVVQNTVIFSADYINKILGTSITPAEIRNILNRYGYMFEEESEVFKVLVPYERIDIMGPHDIVEEIGRAYGYENIEPKLPVIDFKPQVNETFAKINAIKSDLVSKGYHEVQTYSFTKKGDFEVARGPVGKSALRTNLTDGIQKAYELDKLNADLLGISEMKIFEVGTVFPKTGEIIHVAFVDKKGIKEMSLDEYITKFEVVVGAGLPLVGGVDAAAPRGGGMFKMWSEYPLITRDIALWIPEGTLPDEVSKILKENGTELLIREPRLFDTFTKEGKTSVAFRLVFQSFERTLTNEEVDVIMASVYDEVKQKGWEVR